MDVYCGIDWAEDHHDIALADRDGQLLARRRISDDAAGLAQLLALLAEHGDSPETRSRWRSRRPAGCWSRACAPPAGPSTPSTRWRWPATGTGTRSRGRSPTTATRSSWPTCCAPTCMHRPLPADTELAQAIAVLARAQQDAVWDRTPAHNRLRSHLREYFPAFLAAFARPRRHHAPRGPRHPGRRAHPGRRCPPHPDPAARPAEEGRPQPRHRHRSRPAARGVPRPPDAPAPPRRAGHGPPGPGPARPARRRLRRAADLEHAVTESFNLHPDAGIITSFPGLGVLTGARVLAEIGDDRSRFQDAKGLKAYAGAAPITRASGKTRSVTHRRVKNNRLNAAGYIWAFSALTASPGARAHYDRRKDAGDRHAAAQRNLFARLLGCLHHCLITGQHYDEATAFPAPAKKSRRAA